MPGTFILGNPGDSWVNDTGKVAYQFVASLVNTCGACLQYHLAIGPWWPIPLHRGCNCNQVALMPGDSSQPFADFREILSEMSPVEQEAAVGRSAWKLIEEGVVKFEDVVSPTHVLTLQEVVAEQGLTVEQMTEAGVKPWIAEKAYESVNTPLSILNEQRRQALLESIRGAGMSDEQIRELVGRAITERLGIGSGPSGSQVLILTTPPTPIPLIEPLPTFGDAKATIQVDPDKPEAVRQAIEDLLGPNAKLQDIANLAGAPDGTTVTITVLGYDRLAVSVNDSDRGLTMIRDIYRDGSGNLVIRNQSFFIGREFQGQGVGLESLGRQIETALRFGIDRLTTAAAGSAETPDVVGYKVWPKFGYDGPLPNRVWMDLPEEFKDAKQVSDLLATPEGTAWWNEHGSEFGATFDLNPGSYSLQTWEDYLRSKSNP